MLLGAIINDAPSSMGDPHMQTFCCERHDFPKLASPPCLQDVQRNGRMLQVAKIPEPILLP